MEVHSLMVTVPSAITAVPCLRSGAAAFFSNEHDSDSSLSSGAAIRLAVTYLSEPEVAVDTLASVAATFTVLSFHFDRPGMTLARRVASGTGLPSAGGPAAFGSSGG